MRLRRPLSSPPLAGCAALLIVAGFGLGPIAADPGTPVPALIRLLLIIVLFALGLSAAARFFPRAHFFVLAAAATVLLTLWIQRPPPAAPAPQVLIFARLQPAGVSGCLGKPDTHSPPNSSGTSLAAPGLDNLPAYHLASAGEFRSAPLTSHAFLLQLRILGTFAPPQTEILLAPTTTAPPIRPLESHLTATTRWHRLNLRPPTGPFRLIVRTQGPPIAFSAPVEITFAEWFGGKIVRLRSTFILFGIALAVFAFALEARGLDRLAASLRFTRFPWLLLTAYAGVMAFHLDPTAGPNDSGGYLISAKLLSGGAATAAPRFPLGRAESLRWSPDLEAFRPGTLLPTPDGRLGPQYPSGFPLIVAAAARILPLDFAIRTVILLQLLLGVVATYALARECALPRGWAFVAAGIIALSPVYLFQALQPQSDGPALLWVTAAMTLALRLRRQPSAALAAVCGAVAAMAVLIRPSDALMFAPLALCLFGPVPAWSAARHPHREPGIQARTALSSPAPRRTALLLALIGGGAPGAIFLFWYNHRLYGHALGSGYGDASTIGGLFGLRFLRPTLSAYLKWLPAFFTPLVFLAPLAPFLPGIPAYVRVVLTTWVAMFAAFYAVYWCTYDNWYNMRFLLPAAPALVVLGLWGARAAASGQARSRTLAASTWRQAAAGQPDTPAAFPLRALAGALITMLFFTLLIHRAARERVFYWMEANRIHGVAAAYAASHLPPSAVVFANPAANPLFFYTRLPIVRSDSAAALNPAFHDALLAAHKTLYALTYHWEEKNYRWDTVRGKGTGYPDLPGAWSPVATFGDHEMYLWRRVSP